MSDCHPLINKASLPYNGMKSCCPVTGVCFISKLLEQVFASQLIDYINLNRLIRNQSA